MALDATVGGASANSFVDEAFADAYFADRINASDWAAITTKPATLISATDFLSQFVYQGYRVNDTQALPHPRSGMQNRERTAYLPETDIAPDIKTATCELALYLNANAASFQTEDTTTEVKVGPITIKQELKTFGEYSSLPLAVQRLLEPYLSLNKSGGSGSLVRG